jgi:glycine hydroxymethyltransferase
MELANIAANKNTIPGDVSAMTPGGIRMGTPALTTRGFTEEDFEKVAVFFDRAVSITDTIAKKTGIHTYALSASINILIHKDS